MMDDPGHGGEKEEEETGEQIENIEILYGPQGYSFTILSHNSLQYPLFISSMVK